MGAPAAAASPPAGQTQQGKGVNRPRPKRRRVRRDDGSATTGDDKAPPAAAAESGAKKADPFE
jgi:hypothetical protein